MLAMLNFGGGRVESRKFGRATESRKYVKGEMDGREPDNIKGWDLQPGEQ